MKVTPQKGQPHIVKYEVVKTRFFLSRNEIRIYRKSEVTKVLFTIGIRRDGRLTKTEIGSDLTKGTTKRYRVPVNSNEEGMK